MARKKFEAAVMIGFLVGAVSCGTQKKDATKQQPVAKSDETSVLSQEQMAAADSEFNRLPAGVLIRVPVAADGTESREKAELKTAIAAPTDSEIDTAWTNAESANVGSNELDKSTSTQSWHNPSNDYGDEYSNRQEINAVNYGGTQYNINNYGVSNYQSGYGSHNNNGYYNNYYRPVVNSYNGWGYYSYNVRPRCYRSFGYAYYYYSRPSCTYRWCGSSGGNYYGWNSGYGY